MGASTSRNEKAKWNETEAAPTIIENLYISVHVWLLYKASTATSGSFVSYSIVNQVRLYIAVYMLLLLWFLKVEGHIWRG